MGLFSFIGNAVKKIAGTALGLVPGGNIAKGALSVAGQLLSHKQPMGAAATKYQVARGYGIPTLRAQPRPFGLPGGVSSAAARRASPVMPGGAVATSAGIMAPGGGLPPATYGGSRSSSGSRKRKRKSASARRSSRKRSHGKRRSGGRKLKFGSPAWRKKYMKRRGR